MDFVFAGQRIRESTGLRSKTLAQRKENQRRRELEEGAAGVRKRQRPRLLSVAAEEWLKTKASAELAPKTILIEKTNLKHLLTSDAPRLGRKLMSDISAVDILDYRKKRREEGASPKTVNLELGTLRSILGLRLWANLREEAKNMGFKIMFKAQSDVGRALSADEEKALLKECRNSRSQSLYVAVELALSTCMRYSEIRLLEWQQIDFCKEELRVGKSKTEHGEGRVIPLSMRVRTVLEFWAERFPDRKPNHFVFPSARYGGKGTDVTFGFNGSIAYSLDPTQPIGDWKEAWEAAKKRAGVTCRFHDLRHTGCTRLLEQGVPFAVVAEIMGWSASTTIRMAKRYGHIGQSARREALDKLAAATTFDRGGAEQWARRHSAQISKESETDFQSGYPVNPPGKEEDQKSARAN